MSRDVVFDEMSSWYKPINVIDNVDAQNGNGAQNSQQQSQNINRDWGLVTVTRTH